MKVKITRIYRTDKNKDGEPLIAKSGKNKGKPYSVCRIWTEEHGDKMIGGYVNETTAKWKEGDEVEIIVEENGQWLNFKTPSDRITRKEFDEAIKRIDRLEYQMHSRDPAITVIAGSREEMPPPVDENGLPF